MNSEVKRYINAVERRLRLPVKLRARVMSDLLTSISARREQGETDEEIFSSLGTPKEVAAELNEQMKEYAYRKSPWRWLFFVMALLSALWLGMDLLLPLLFMASVSESQGVGIIGGADGPTAIFVTTTPGISMEAIIAGALLILSLILFFRLRRCRPKDEV